MLIRSQHGGYFVCFINLPAFGQQTRWALADVGWRRSRCLARRVDSSGIEDEADAAQNLNDAMRAKPTDSLRQLPCVDREKLRHIDDAGRGEIALPFWQQHVAGSLGPPQV